MLVVPAVLSAWRRTAHPKEKGGAVTARRMLHPFHKGLVSSMVHAEGLQEIPMVNAPVVGNKLIHLPAFSRPSVRTRLMANMELEVSVETEAGVGATALQRIKMRYRFVQQALLQMLAHAAKSVLIQLAPQKEINGVASAKQRHHYCQKGLVSLMVLVPELQTALMTTPLVPAATQNMFRHVTQHPSAKLHIQERDSGASVGIKVSLAGTALVQMYLVVSFSVTERAVRAARSVSTGLALTREKGGSATVRKKPTICPKDPASLTIPVPSHLGHHTMVPVLVARRIRPPQPHHVTQHPNAKLHIQEQDSGASVGIKVSLVGTALVQMFLVVSFSVTERAVRAARSAWTRSAQRRERAGVATTGSLRLPYLRVLASLTALVLLPLALPTMILHVHAANPWSPLALSPVKTMDAPKSGMEWGPVSMYPMQTGQMWMQASTLVFLVFLASVVQLHAVSAFKRSPVQTKGVPDSLKELGFASMCWTLTLPKRVLSLTLLQEGGRTSVVLEQGMDAAPVSKRKNV